MEMPKSQKHRASMNKEFHNVFLLFPTIVPLIEHVSDSLPMILEDLLSVLLNFGIDMHLFYYKRNLKTFLIK